VTAPAPVTVGRLFTIMEAAERLSVSHKTLRKMIDRRTIRAVRIGHGRGVLRISDVELQRVIDEGTSSQ
jgi:excisionase family DNA binding protein